MNSGFVSVVTFSFSIDVFVKSSYFTYSSINSFTYHCTQVFKIMYLFYHFSINSYQVCFLGYTNYSISLFPHLFSRCAFVIPGDVSLSMSLYSLGFLFLSYSMTVFNYLISFLIFSFSFFDQSNLQYYFYHSVLMYPFPMAWPE